MSEHLPPRFAELERELDRIARRLLAEQLEGDPMSVTTTLASVPPTQEPEEQEAN